MYPVQPKATRLHTQPAPICLHNKQWYPAYPQLTHVSLVQPKATRLHTQPTPICIHSKQWYPAHPQLTHASPVRPGATRLHTNKTSAHPFSPQPMVTCLPQLPARVSCTIKDYQTTHNANAYSRCSHVSPVHSGAARLRTRPTRARVVSQSVGDMPSSQTAFCGQYWCCKFLRYPICYRVYSVDEN